MNSKLFFFFGCFLFFEHTLGEIVEYSPCDNEESKCDFHEVRIEPCKEAARNAACKIKRGKTATLSFDFTPKFSGQRIKSQAFWASGIGDLPFMGMDTDGCKCLTCPLEADTKSTYSYALTTAKSYPIRVYDVKWKVWNEENEQCCLMIQIQITK